MDVSHAARSGSLAGLRLCMVMHVGNSGASRAWQGLLGRRPDWGIDPPAVNGYPQSIGLRERAVCASAQASYAAASTAGDSASGTTGTGLTSPAAG
jgi:hypothetical protein